MILRIDYIHMKAFFSNYYFSIITFIVFLIIILNLHYKWRIVKSRREPIQRRYLKQPYKKLNFWVFIFNIKNIKSISFGIGLLTTSILNFINWSEIFLFLKKLDWNIIVENSLSGLFVGLTVGGLGYLIWKKQHFYQKRLEVYADLIPYLIKLKIYLIGEIHSSEYCDPFKQKMNEEIMYKTLPLAHQFAVYYDYSYLNNINDLILLLDKLRKKEETGMNKRELEEYVNLIANRIISAKYE